MFVDFFESSPLPDSEKNFINTKNPNENKEFLAKIKNGISDLKERIKEINEKEKRKLVWGTKNYWRDSWLQ